MINRLRFIPTSEEIPAVRQLLSHHLTELEGHTRELAAMNAKLRKENETMRALLSKIKLNRAEDDWCVVCGCYVWDCEPSCEGKQLTEVLVY